MYLSNTIVLALLAALPSVLGSPLLENRQNGVTCQTSDGSPETADVTAVINQLRGQGGSCPQTNGKASDCTTLVSHNSAAIAVCGGEEDESAGSLCADLAGFANQIQQTCKNKGNPVRAGGTYTVSASKRLEVINSNST